jgi:hypothetical protein
LSAPFVSQLAGLAPAQVYGPDATQEDLYDDAVAPIVEQVCSGLNCCIFAYGQTGAGKVRRHPHPTLEALQPRAGSRPPPSPGCVPSPLRSDKDVHHAGRPLR